MKPKYFHKTINIRVFKFLCLSLFASAFCSNSSAQVGLNYIYDANGNRIASNIVIIPVNNRPKNKDTSKKDSVPCVITVYPNPTNGQVNLSIPCIENCDYAMIYISDLTGNFISTQKATSTIQQINLTSYNQGTYYLKVVMCNEQYSYKVVKLTPTLGTPPKPAGPSKF